MRACCIIAILTTAIGCNDDPAKKDGWVPPGRDSRSDIYIWPTGDRGQRERGVVEGGPGDRALADAHSEAGTSDGLVKPDSAASYCGTKKVLRCDCYGYSTKKGKFIPLWGTAAKSTTFPDFRVRVVTGLGQLKVDKSSPFGSKCGQWTTSGIPSFTYEEVTIGEDFTVEYTTVFPGLNMVMCPGCAL